MPKIGRDMQKEKLTVSAQEITKEYEKQLKAGIFPAGLYSIYALGPAQGKQNPKAFVIEDANMKKKVMGIFGYKTSTLAIGVISWDKMSKKEICPEISISPTMVVEPLVIFNAGPTRNTIYTSENYKS